MMTPLRGLRGLAALVFVCGTAACAVPAPVGPPPASPTLSPRAPTAAPTGTATSTPAVTATTALATLQFNGEQAYASVVQQVALGPRITGSAPHRQLGDQILTQLASSGWVTRTQEFTYQETPVRNLIGIKGTGSEVVILGAHYDTRRRADQDQRQPNQPVPGANDGASG